MIWVSLADRILRSVSDKDVKRDRQEESLSQ